MKLQVMSDLHVEFGPVDVPPTPADVLVLAGDIDLGLKGLGFAGCESQVRDTDEATRRMKTLCAGPDA